MNGRTRTLLAIAMSTALIAPVAFAQKVKTEVKTTGNVTSQAAKDTPRPSLPTQAAQRAVDATTEVTAERPAKRAADAVDARVVPAAKLPVPKDQAAIEPRNPEIPPTAQGAAHAAAHSSVVQRDTWARLDADGDGRISATEADLDATFDGDFTAIDTDKDGFVSDAEYRAFAKVDASQGAANAAAHSSVVTRDLWARLDADGDGRISATEADIDASFDGDFATIDANKDGFVSDVEYRTFAKLDVAQGAVNAASHSAVAQRATWSRLDIDGDGRISPVEADADAGVDGSFAVIDSNSDGFITDVELRAHAKATSKP